MLPPNERRCHRTGFKQSCRGLVASGKCGRWDDIAYKHHETGEQRRDWLCLDDMVPILLLQLGWAQHQTTKSVDKVANEVKTGAERQAAASTEVVASNARLGHQIGAVCLSALETVAVASRPALPNGHGPKMIEGPA